MKAELQAAIEAQMEQWPHRRSALISALALVQEANGWVSHDDTHDLAELFGLPLCEVHGVVSYYTLLRTRPVGRYHLQLDTCVPAMLMGASEILAHLEHVLGICAGQTTPDGLFTLSTVQDLGSGGTCPILQVGDRRYDGLTKERVDELLSMLRQGTMPSWLSTEHWSSRCDNLLRRRGNPRPADVGLYVEDGGYQALRTALSMEPEAVVAEVKASSLRGRGGAGFPTGIKWSFVPRPGPASTSGGASRPVYLVCNADEGEPGTFKDRQILEHDPHLLIEGMAIAGHAVGAKLGFVYLRGEYASVARCLRTAIDQARSHGFLGHDVLGLGVVFDILVAQGAGSYVCGEETALIESLEGRRGNPRMKPPFPASAGLWGCPTVVNNVETLANVPFILSKGAGAFRAIGTRGNAGPKIFGVSGHVWQPGAYELPMGTLLSEVISEAGGVVGKLKAVIVGGLSVPILAADECTDLHLDFDACLKRGTMFGSGAVIVLNDTVSIPKLAQRAIQFYAHESCGQCTPCREGSIAVKRLLDGLVEGHGTVADIESVLWLCRAIRGTGLCPTADAFSIPIEAMVRKFREEFDALAIDASRPLPAG
jgi:NADH:ubiquinone oxidoreductase subunit F (NADH-binding)/NADH:ubiquinone oxidoreductase subunit E